MGNIKPKIYERYRTIADFCREANIGENRMSRIITGRIKPDPKECQAISEKLGISSDEITS